MKYRIMPHDGIDRFYRIERKFLFLWITVSDYYASWDDAVADLKRIKEQV